MILGILIVNNHGKPRLSKFYQRTSQDEQQHIVNECFKLVSKRPDNVCNFVEGSRPWGMPKEGGVVQEFKLIYRHYATLYFIFAVDGSESELGILDLIQVFVEALDRKFENVCELDLIFHSDQVHYILDEIVMGGMVLETNLKEIIKAVNGMEKYEKNSKAMVKKREAQDRAKRRAVQKGK